MVSNDLPNDGDSDDAAPTSKPSDRAGRSEQRGDVTQILSAIEQGDGQGAERLLPLIYDELRRLAAVKMAGESPDNTLQATALVHEAYVRLVDVDEAQQWDSRGHFFSAAAEAMRRILVEQARRRSRLKRGGDFQRLSLAEIDLAAMSSPDDVIVLNEAIEKLAADDETAANLVKLLYFAGLTVEQAASALRVSTATAYRHWAYARSWLSCEITSGSK